MARRLSIILSCFVELTHLLRWWIAVAEIIIYAKSVDNLYIVAKPRLRGMNNAEDSQKICRQFFY
jgi:hypothetical protein